MKQQYFILSAAIALALASAPGVLLAQPAVGSAALAGINTSEAPRVTQTVTNSSLITIPKTHLNFVAQATTSTPLADTVAMNHMQLVLKPSARRAAAIETLITNQHTPKSAQFQQWLTPQQFGDTFGVVDGDIAAAIAWLTAQGFTVNSVYPNKTQIDFSGTAGQVKQAFHTQEANYTLSDGSHHVANATDIRIPVALQPIVAGVLGLHDVHPTALVTKPKLVQWNASKKGFVAITGTSTKTGTQPISQAIGTIALRGLVPNDMATMYGTRTLHNNGVTGKGINIAVVESNDMVPSDWTNFVSTFNLGQYGGTFQQFNPPAPSGANNCNDPDIPEFGESVETVLDAEWATAFAPGANVWVVTCSGFSINEAGQAVGPVTTDNFFGGVYLAATNLINGPTRPDVISASYGFGEESVDSTSKTEIDLMWQQADAEGISVFVATGDSGSNPSFNGGIINGLQAASAVDANAFGTSPHDTGVGGTDLADILDGTTSQYFAPTPSVVGGSALSYVPEIPWNASCGNGVAATAAGFSSAIGFCQFLLGFDPQGTTVTSEAGSGGPSAVDAKPAWQKQIFNAAKDQSRDLPDVALFAGSYGTHTAAVVCTGAYPCTPGFTRPVNLVEGTSLATPMFAGIQGLIDQGLHDRGLPTDQGNAAPTLYALAAGEYGTATGPTPSSLAICNANNGVKGTSACVFHNVTRGSISTQCIKQNPSVGSGYFNTPNCYYYGALSAGDLVVVGLTTSDAAPSSYGVANKAFGAQPGWSFATGLGSVNATNLLIAWRAYVNAPPAAR